MKNISERLLLYTPHRRSLPEDVFYKKVFFKFRKNAQENIKAQHEFCEIFKDTFLVEPLRTVASVFNLSQISFYCNWAVMMFLQSFE